VKLPLTAAGLRNESLRQALAGVRHPGAQRPAPRNGHRPPAARRRHLRRGGNRYHLARSITGNGLADGFRQALEDRVYVGISGGSMIFSRALDERSADIFEDDHLRVLGATTVQPPFGFFDWYLQPHLYSPAFPNWGDAGADRIAARAGFPIYFIDDDSAVRVDGDAVDVVGEGRWRYMP
jgi:dipeptidase E